MEISVNNKCMAFTSLEQSRKLAEILPLESADMWYHGHYSPLESERKYDNEPCPFHSTFPNWDKPCWSLAALLELIPRCIDIGAFKDCIFNFSKAADEKSYIVNYIQYREYSSFPTIVKQIITDNAIDTLFKTVYWLKENNML